MGVMPGARWRDVGAPAKYSNGLMRVHLGVVLHVNDSQGDQVTSVNGDSLYNWITGDHGMSCHFQVSQMGVIEQYIDTRYSSWCQAGGNDTYLSIETEGRPDTPLTGLQVQACAAILAFAHAEHGIPLQLAEQPGDLGFGWHGMGAPGWGHAACPGELRKAQRSRILALAAGGGQPVQEDDLPNYTDWAQKDRDALANDVVKALLDRQMGGIGYASTYASLLGAILGQAKLAAQAKVDPAQIAAAVREAVSSLPASSGVDPDALADAVATKLGERLVAQ